MRADRRRLLKIVALLGTFALAVRVTAGLATAWFAPEALAYGEEPFDEDPARLQRLETAGRLIKPLHQRLNEPEPGAWRARHHEPAQSFASYAKSAPPRPTPARHVIYLQQWGELSPEQRGVAEQASQLIGLYFDTQVRWLPDVPMGSLDLAEVSDLHPPAGERRLFASQVLGRLIARGLPADAASVVAITPLDLTRTGGGTWAFGQASLMDRVAVVSFHRQGDPREDFNLCLRRFSKTCLHEVGHSFGIAHCVENECGMNGSSSREEADSRPLWFCAEDEMKVWLACGLDPASRYAALEAWAATFDLREESQFWRRSRKALGPKSH